MIPQEVQSMSDEYKYNYNKLEQSDKFYADTEEFQKEEKPKEKAETWAEDARDDLEDWIECQGIELRY